MAQAADWNEDDPLAVPGPAVEPPEPPLTAYQAALRRYEGARLFEIHAALGPPDLRARSNALPAAIAESLREPRVIERLIASVGDDSRLALGLFALTETTSWSFVGLSHALTCLGVDPLPALLALLQRGLAALWLGNDGGPVYDFDRAITSDLTKVSLRAHPSVLSAARTVLPPGAAPAVAGPVRQVRESDGLEPILRMAAVWQRVVEGPLRQTQQVTLYKRDRDRVEDDPVLAGPIADALEPLPDMAALWLTLAQGVGLLRSEAGSDRVVAASPEFWEENAIHLPQMVAVRWLSLRGWDERGGMQQEGSTVELAFPHVRPAVLLWLARLAEAEWLALEDLAQHLEAHAPHWDRPAFFDAAPAVPSPRGGKGKRGKADGRTPAGGPEVDALEALLLGAAYQFGLVRTGEEVPTGRRVVQLSALGRYILAIGPPPPPRPTFDQFLYVQPNFEIIAYRQGLTPALIGQFSRFALWSQVGAALELKLTPESVYRGLEGGLSSEAMLERLKHHSARPLPAGIAEALRTWSQRRERVSYYSATTLVEFSTREDLEHALAHWPASARVAPVAMGERFLLVEDAASIPFQRFRLTGSRDYRRPAETCLEVEPDGITLGLDLARSDLLVDAELSRFTEEFAPATPRRSSPNPRRRFRVSAESLARGIANGLTLTQLGEWYLRRAGVPMPPAVRLMLLAGGGRVPTLEADRPLVLHAPSAELLDGLLQHPETSPFVGERLGPTAVVIPFQSLEPLRLVLRRIGIQLDTKAAETPR
ncbi:MAG: helicase-associated domain-containing protein [Isosphaeraceae bacterium]|nr:helicase-associated domain-containing protein [Isosphaeraceae bacterium]